MALIDSIAKDMIRNMDKQERERFVSRMLDAFFQTMSIDERKGIMIKFIPDLVSRVMEGMSPSDRKMVVEEAISAIANPKPEAKERGPEHR